VQKHIVRERVLGDGVDPMENRRKLIPQGCLRRSGIVENIVDFGEKHW
jgi:hypothetical protein